MRNVSIKESTFSLSLYLLSKYKAFDGSMHKDQVTTNLQKEWSGTSYITSTHSCSYWMSVCMCVCERENISLLKEEMKRRKNGLVVHLSDYMLVRIIFLLFFFTSWSLRSYNGYFFEYISLPSICLLSIRILFKRDEISVASLKAYTFY